MDRSSSYRIMLRAKLHKAHVTSAVRDYEGSISIDMDLLDAVDMVPYEQVMIANTTNGNRFETYIIKGERGSGEIGINGAATHLAGVGDEIIIFAYAPVAEENVAAHRPNILVLDENNRPAKTI